MIRITNIQRMCFHDGPGIRTTVFLKGCTIKCPWCSNPENISFEIEHGFGRDVSIEPLMKELLKDKIFWEQSGGGVTFSGGEPLAQIQSLSSVLLELRGYHVHTLFESALFVQHDLVRTASHLTDEFIVDLKIVDKAKCYEFLGLDVDIYQKNVELLYGAGKIHCFRIPCSKMYTLNQDNREALLEYVYNFSDVPVQIFALHEFGKAKYERLGLRMPSYDVVSNEILNSFKVELESVGAKVEIIEL